MSNCNFIYCVSAINHRLEEAFFDKFSPYQAVLDPAKPLAGMTSAKRDQAWVRICEEIEKAVNSGSELSAKPPALGGALTSTPPAITTPSVEKEPRSPGSDHLSTLPADWIDQAERYINVALYLNRGLPGTAVYDLSTVRQNLPLFQ